MLWYALVFEMRLKRIGNSYWHEKYSILIVHQTDAISGVDSEPKTIIFVIAII